MTETRNAWHPNGSDCTEPEPEQDEHTRDRQQKRDEFGRFVRSEITAASEPTAVLNAKRRTVMRRVFAALTEAELHQIETDPAASMQARTCARQLLGQFEHGASERIAVALASADARMDSELERAAEAGSRYGDSPSVTIEIKGGEVGPDGQALLFDFEREPEPGDEDEGEAEDDGDE